MANMKNKLLKYYAIRHLTFFSVLKVFESLLPQVRIYRLFKIEFYVIIKLSSLRFLKFLLIKCLRTIVFYKHSLE